MKPILFPFAQYWWAYLFFSLAISCVLWISIRHGSNQPKEIGVKRAAISAISWFLVAMLFNLAFYFFVFLFADHDPERLYSLYPDRASAAGELSLQFLSGYLVEKSLAIDNLFVFVVIFRFFGIPAQYQPRVLFYGLFGAIVLRAVFIALGAFVMRFEWMVIAFGVFLIYQGLQILRDHKVSIEPEKNWILKLLKRYIPLGTSLDGEKFFTKVNAKTVATPLFVTLVFVELTDIMFAFDSVPAIFGLTREPLVVFTSNIFAVIDLRSLYFLLAAFIDRFHFLSVGLSLVLLFIGCKMALIDPLLHGKFPTELSLMIVLGIILLSILISLVYTPKNLQKVEATDKPPSNEPKDK